MISDRVKKVPPSGIREFFDLVLGMPDVISLGVGEPDFITPWRIREKAITSLEEGMTSYTSNQGLLILREAIAGRYKEKYEVAYSAEKEILITVGVSEALDLVLRTILDPNDYVIVITPSYVAYPALVELNYGKVLNIDAKKENGFKIDLKELKRAVAKNPKAMIFNYPCNPTGVTYSKEELAAIWKVLAKTDTIIISDEVYDELVYEGRHYPFAGISKEAKKRTVTLNGFSKGQAMTGFRCGYACGPEQIISGMTKIHAYSMLCAPITAQIAACEAFNVEKEVKEMVKHYKSRRDYIVREFNRLGMVTLCPEGAFYCFPDIKKFKMNALDFAKKLLFQEKVAVIPGTAFGRGLDNYLRVSYANTLEDLKEAIVRIERFLSGIK